jgi:glycosyltransferase involved in cell wall biosynthesis
MVSKVVFVANYLPDKQESMLRLSELFRAVLEEVGLETETIRSVDRIGKLRRFFPRLEKWLGYVDKYLVFPWELWLHAFRTRRERGLVYHITDHSNAVYSFVLRGRPRVATCNDVLAIRSALGEIPENPTGVTGRFLQKAILAGLRHSPRIVCISGNSAHELRRLLGDGGQKITSALLPLNFEFSPMPEEAAVAAIGRLGFEVREAVRAGFILHVGGNQWYKNRKGVCAIYAALARLREESGKPVVPLILAGQKPSAEIEEFARIHSELPMFFVTAPTNEEVWALYSLASVLLFPSLQEGFGWPIVEAMACGCPVVTTGRAPMTEAGGDAAVYIEPSDAVASARTLNQVLEGSPAERMASIERGFANVKRFGRTSLAEHYIAAYREVLASAASP